MLGKIKKLLKQRIILPYLTIKYNKIQGNKIVVDNFYGKGFGDNPKYIVESLLKKNNNLDIVWLVNSMDEPFPKGIRKVPINSMRAVKELLTASVWIDNIKNFEKPLKKANQFYLQTWHAGLGIKASEGQIEDLLSSDYVNAARADAQQTDLMLSDSRWTTNIYSNYFWYSGKIVETGFPRNDILINNSKKVKEKVRKYFSIPYDSKIIIYAPTFRDKENGISVYQHDFMNIKEAAEREFKCKYRLLIRLHPNLNNTLKNKIGYYFDNKVFFDASEYPDMQELIVASDILITDYSSCMFDGMLAGKRVFLLASDYSVFIEEDRKLLFDIKKELPFSLSISDRELIKNISNFNRNNYLEKVNSFKNKIKLKEPGNSSEVVANIVLKHIGQA